MEEGRQGPEASRAEEKARSLKTGLETLAQALGLETQDKPRLAPTKDEAGIQAPILEAKVEATQAFGAPLAAKARDKEE